MKTTMVCAVFMLGVLGAGGEACARKDNPRAPQNPRWASKAEKELFASGFATAPGTPVDDNKKYFGFSMAPGVAKDICDRSLGAKTNWTDTERNAVEGYAKGPLGWALSRKRITYSSSF